jgi:hypothetical protein
MRWTHTQLHLHSLGSIYKSAMQPHHKFVWLLGHSQMHVRSLWQLPDTRSESGDTARYTSGATEVLSSRGGAA